MESATTQLLDQYRQNTHSQLLHSIIKECLERIEYILSHEYSSHYNVKGIEDRLLQMHDAVISGEPVSHHQLTPIRFELYHIQRSCVVNEYHFEQKALLFGILGIFAGIIAYLSSENYYSWWGMGIGVFGALFFGALYLDLDF